MMVPFQEVPSNRLPELMDVLEEIEGKVVIWAHWQRDVHRILREISKKFGENSFVDYYGLTPMADRQKNIEKFQNNSLNADFLLVLHKQVVMVLH